MNILYLHVRDISSLFILLIKSIFNFILIFAPSNTNNYLNINELTLILLIYK
jgi:hypothetical protein